MQNYLKIVSRKKLASPLFIRLNELIFRNTFYTCVRCHMGSGDGLGHGHTALDQFGNKTYDRGAFEEHGKQNYTDDSKGVTIYDRRARPGHEAMGIEGQSNLHGQPYNPKKHPDEVGHITQFYEDGVRISRSTTDNVHETRTHWTDTRLPKWHPDYHRKPED